MIVTLTGGLKNVGDFLIAERARALLARFVDAEQLDLPRRLPVTPRLDEVNRARAVICCGGPALAADLYPGIYPLAEPLERLAAPLVAFGLGWSGKPFRRPEDFRFTERSQELLRRFHADGRVASVRDEITLDLLRRAGHPEAVMTGCPVWYDLESLGQPYRHAPEVRRLVFTTPASIRLARPTLAVMRLLAKRFPRAERICAFHRGIRPDRETSLHQGLGYLGLAAAAVALGYRVRDVSYDTARIAFYADCDLHVGFRVHAHLYFLSKRLASFLINEDGRGAGMAASLEQPGLDHDDPALLARLDAQLTEHLESRGRAVAGAVDAIERHWPTMRRFLAGLA
jgi:hypothetical protein